MQKTLKRKNLRMTNFRLVLTFFRAKKIDVNRLELYLQIMQIQQLQFIQDMHKPLKCVINLHMTLGNIHTYTRAQILFP